MFAGVLHNLKGECRQRIKLLGAKLIELFLIFCACWLLCYTVVQKNQVIFHRNSTCPNILENKAGWLYLIYKNFNKKKPNKKHRIPHIRIQILYSSFENFYC